METFIRTLTVRSRTTLLSPANHASGNAFARRKKTVRFSIPDMYTTSTNFHALPSLEKNASWRPIWTPTPYIHVNHSCAHFPLMFQGFSAKPVETSRVCESAGRVLRGLRKGTRPGRGGQHGDSRDGVGFVPTEVAVCRLLRTNVSMLNVLNVHVAIARFLA